MLPSLSEFNTVVIWHITFSDSNKRRNSWTYHLGIYRDLLLSIENNLIILTYIYFKFQLCKRKDQEFHLQLLISIWHGSKDIAESVCFSVLFCKRKSKILKIGRMFSCMKFLFFIYFNISVTIILKVFCMMSTSSNVVAKIQIDLSSFLTIIIID